MTSRSIPVRRSNQLSYEATDVGSWSFVSSNEPVKNGCEVIYEMFWTGDLKSSQLWSSQLWTQFKQLHIEAWKSQDFNGAWTRDLVIPVRHSNHLSYEATDVESWSFVSSIEPVKNGCEVIYEMFHILNCRFEMTFHISLQYWLYTVNVQVYQYRRIVMYRKKYWLLSLILIVNYRNMM